MWLATGHWVIIDQLLLQRDDKQLRMNSVISCTSGLWMLLCMYGGGGDATVYVWGGCYYVWGGGNIVLMEKPTLHLIRVLNTYNYKISEDGVYRRIIMNEHTNPTYSSNSILSLSGGGGHNRRYIYVHTACGATACNRGRQLSMAPKSPICLQTASQDWLTTLLCILTRWDQSISGARIHCSVLWLVDSHSEP